MKVGDLIRLFDGYESFNMGLVCDIDDHGPNNYTGPGVVENRYWTMWDDGEYSWIHADDDAVVISESR